MATVTYERGKHRFYDLLFGLLVNAIYSVLGVKASRIVRENIPEPLPIVGAGSFIILGGIETDIKFVMTAELLDSLIAGKVPKTFDVEKFVYDDPGEPKIIDANDIGHTDLFKAVFVNYYESVIDDIEIKYGSRAQYQTWPPILRFSRVIRHAFAHDGKVYITGRNAQIETWHGFSYGPADNGITILFNGMGAGDLVELMDQMDHELQ